MFKELLEPVQKAVAAGDSPNCLAASLIENNNNLNDKETAWLAGTMFGAGAETTVAALSVFMLAMTLYPDVLRKAQVEVDEVFQPERFLDSTGTIDIVPTDTHGRGHISFGFGRRICVGLSVVNQTLFIDMAYLVWALNIRKAKDSDGNPITPSRTDEIDDGLVVRPVPFTCDITSRGENTVSFLEAAQLS
ncbi:cytochrome P450 [Mycena olivaceomarginata]|nr:cytochrome P450 [Mycena olivaceomarginata]